MLKLSCRRYKNIIYQEQSNCYNYSGALMPAWWLAVNPVTAAWWHSTRTTSSEKWRFKPGNALVTTADYVTGKPPAVTLQSHWMNTAWVPANDGCLYNIALADGTVLKKINLGGAHC